MPSNLTHSVYFFVPPITEPSYFSKTYRQAPGGTPRARLFPGLTMFTLSREADYAVRVMVHMASGVEERFQSKTLAKDESIPESFRFKILRTLIRHGVVRSYRGAEAVISLRLTPQTFRSIGCSRWW